MTGGPEPSSRRDDPLRVMIVDDSAAFRGAARALIEACAGLTVSGEAGSGEEALASLRSCRPDMILLDVHLPGIDGPETCRRLQADDPHLGILLVSADDHDPSASSECRPTAFLRKSELSPRRLTACLEAMRR